MELNDFGNIVNNWWYEIPEHFKNVRLDEWQIMPNHVHGIIQINSNHGRGNHAPTTLGQIVGYYKYQSTKQFNAIVGAGSSRPRVWEPLGRVATGGDPKTFLNPVGRMVDDAIYRK